MFVFAEVRGELRCLGTPAHVKQIHGRGYRLEMLLCAFAPDGPSRADVEDFVQAMVPGSTLAEAHCGRFIFAVPPLAEGQTLAEGFRC